MPADDVLWPPGAPELDEYGVPVQQPPKSQPYLLLTSYLVGVVIQVAAALTYLRYEHQVSTAGIRFMAAAAMVIGWLPRRWGDKKFGTARLSPLGRTVTTICLLLLIFGTGLLFAEVVSPHGLAWCHHNCDSGGY
jgi:hypothetical protein